MLNFNGTPKQESYGKTKDNLAKSECGPELIELISKWRQV